MAYNIENAAVSPHPLHFSAAESGLIAGLALISLTSCSLFLGYVVWLYAGYYWPRLSLFINRHLHKQANARHHHEARMPERSTGLEQLQTQFGVLFCSMIFADAIQSLGFALNFRWIAIGSAPSDTVGPNAITCSTQGAFIAAGNVASSLSSILIAVHTVAMIVGSRRPKSRMVAAGIVFLWTTVIMFGVSGPYWVESDAMPFYRWTNCWCFIATAYQPFRLYFHYIELMLACVVNVVAYITIFASISIKARRSAAILGRSSPTQAIAKKMLLFPAAYAAVTMPITCFRLAGMTGHQGPTQLQTACGAILVLQGTVNLILFSYTRSVVCIRAHSTRLPTVQSQPATDQALARPDVTSRRQSYLVQLQKESLASGKRDSLGNVYAPAPVVGSLEWAMRQSPEMPVSADLALDVVDRGTPTFTEVVSEEKQKTDIEN